MITTLARVALALILVGTAALALYRHGHIVRQHRFNRWPVLAALVVEAALIYFAGGWG
jgi:hypothetical protein